MAAAARGSMAGRSHAVLSLAATLRVRRLHVGMCNYGYLVEARGNSGKCPKAAMAYRRGEQPSAPDRVVNIPQLGGESTRVVSFGRGRRPPPRLLGVR